MMVLFDDVWDPTANNIFDVTVESFHLALFSEDKKLNATLTSRFLRHIGQFLRRLIIDGKFSIYQVSIFSTMLFDSVLVITTL